MSSRIARAHIVVPHTPTTTSATRDPAPTQPFWRVSVNSGRYYAVAACIDPGSPVVDDCLCGPAVPQLFHHLHELLAAGIAIGVAHLPSAAVIFRCGGQP